MQSGSCMHFREVMMMRTNRADLENKLSKIDAALAAHPYNAPDASASREIIEEFKEAGNERIEQELTARGLPGLVDNGRTVAGGLFSYGRLHRRRQKILNKLNRIST